MGNFNKGKGGKFGGGGKKFGGQGGGDRGDRGGNRGFGGGRDGGRPQMHKAVCSDCGSNCEVPFRPTGDKPIFCSDCFSGKRDKGDNRNDRGGRNERGGDRGFGGRDSKPRFDDKQSHKGDGGKDGVNYKAQFDMLNAKMDKIIKMLNPDVSEEVEKISEETPKFEKTKTKVKNSAKQKVDTKALKKVVEKAIEKKSVKKVAAKKVVKKADPKKVVAKKVVSKKVAVKKAATKKKPAVKKKK